MNILNDFFRNVFSWFSSVLNQSSPKSLFLCIHFPQLNTETPILFLNVPVGQRISVKLESLVQIPG